MFPGVPQSFYITRQILLRTENNDYVFRKINIIKMKLPSGQVFDKISIKVKGIVTKQSSKSVRERRNAEKMNGARV